MKVRKNPILWLAPAAFMATLLWVEVLPWLANRPSLGALPLTLWIANATVWMLVLWWASHHATFELASLFAPRDLGAEVIDKERPRIAILYATCDDFMKQCAASCLDQDYPERLWEVFICDDSRCEEYRAAVDAFCRSNPRAVKVRRENRAGHKAGNLNHAFRKERLESFDWILPIDADQKLPKEFVGRLARRLAAAGDRVAFVQAGREPMQRGLDSRQTAFQAALEAEMLVQFERDLRYRDRFGFLPFLGHGGAIRSAVWKRLGGLPECVSEDYAFSMMARRSGYLGERAEDVRSEESYPKDFGAFAVRWRKFAAGAGEMARHQLLSFVFSREVTMTERLDVAMFLLSYALMPATLVNVLLSGYLTRLSSAEYHAMLARRLPYVFLGLALATLPVSVSVDRSTPRAVRRWFWAFAVYGAALPMASCAFIAGLFRRPSFEVTPKGKRASPALPVTGGLTSLLGLGYVALALYWRSPFSPVLASWGAAFAFFPLYRWLHIEGTWPGGASRAAVYAPGALYLWGVISMWLWGAGW